MFTKQLVLNSIYKSSKMKRVLRQDGMNVRGQVGKSGI